LKTQLTAKETILDSNKEVQKQMQATIDGLTLAVEANNRTNSDLMNTQKSNQLTIQELRERQKQCQATVNGKTTTEEAMKPAVQLPCGQQKEVSTRKVQAIANSKWAETQLSINTVEPWLRAYSVLETCS
jgi:predicted  nucleic acid-binding Zn-ribbon protein